MPAVSAAGQRKGEMIPGTFWPDVADRRRGSAGGGIPRKRPRPRSLGLETVLANPRDMGFTPRLAHSFRRQKPAPVMKGPVSSGSTATAHSFAQTAEDPTPGQTGGTTLAGAAEDRWRPQRWFQRARLDGGGAGTRREEVRRETLAKGKHHTGNGFGLSFWGRRPVFTTPAAQNVKGQQRGQQRGQHHARGRQKSRMDILHHRAEQGFSRPVHLTAPPGPTPRSRARSGARQAR